MADDQPTDNKARLEYEAVVNEESFQRAEQRTQQSANKTSAANKATSVEAEREARNRVRSAEKETSDEIAALKVWQREQDRIRREASTTAGTLHNDEARAFAERVKRENAQLNEAAAIKKAMLQDEGKLNKDVARTKDKSLKDETASLKEWQREQDRIRKEAASTAKALSNDEARAQADAVNRENAKLREAAAIRKAMREDEAKRIKQISDLESNVAKQRIAEDRRRREQAVYTPAQIRKFQQDADRLLEMLGGGSNGPGGPPNRPPNRIGGTTGGNGRGWGGGRGIDPFLTSFGFGLTSVGNVPGGRVLGSVALGQGFGGIGGLYGALAGGAVGGGLLLAITSIKQAMEDTEAEKKFIGAILQVGASFESSKQAAESFHTTLKLTRQESLALAGAFGAAGTRIVTRPGDVSSISDRAAGTGQSAEDIAKALEAISRGSKEAFEAQTGLKANQVINEYARSLGKLPQELTETAKAQALYNKFIQQGANYQDLANKNMQTGAARITAFKNATTDFLGEYGTAWLDIFDSFRHKGSSILGFETFEEFAQRKRDEADALVRTQNQPQLAEQYKEQQRQRELELRYEDVSLKGQLGLKELQRERPGETAADRLKSLIEFRREFQSSIQGLDEADIRIKAITNDIEQGFAQAVGKAYTEVEQLRKSLRTMTGDFATLQLPGQNNPFVKIYTDAANAADVAYDKFRLLGDEVVQQYAAMQRAAAEAELFQVRVQTEMKATSLEFEAARLSKPFIELTGEMKHSLSILQTEVAAAIQVPQLQAAAKSIELFAGYRIPRANERGFGLFGQSEIGGVAVAQQQFDELLKLRRRYGAGLTPGDIGESETRHLIDQEFIKLFQSLPPALQAQALRAPGSRGPQGYATIFQGAYQGEAAHAKRQIEQAIGRAEVERGAIKEASQRVARIQSFNAETEATRIRADLQKSTGRTPDESIVQSISEGRKQTLRSEILAITGAIPREQLTPELLKGRIEALKEEAVNQRKAQDAAIKAVDEAVALRNMLDARLQSILDSVKGRQEDVLLRILDDSGRTRVNALGPAMNPLAASGAGQLARDVQF